MLIRAARSIRARLAAWHTAAVAALLAVFSLGTWLFVTRTATARADQGLADYTRAYVDGWTGERVELAAGDDVSHATTLAAAADAAREYRYQDRRVYVFDAMGRLAAVSDTAPLAPALSLRAVASAGGPLAALRAQARPDRAAVATLEGDGASDEVPVRALATRVAFGGIPFTVVTLRSLRAEDEAAEAFAEALAVAVPLALVLAAAGGYWLTRASLAPVVAMGRAAARIGGDATLHERLPVLTPHDELGELATIFNGLLSRVEDGFARQARAAEQQRQFMADASHELRTPVTALASVSDVALARADRDPAELREALGVVRGEARRLGRIVDDLFLLARADAGQLPVRPEPIYLEEVVQGSVRAVRALAASRGVALDAPLGDEAPFTGDPHLLGRLLLNLLDNAVKFTPAGGRVCIGLTRERVATADDATYVVTVEDTGCGVGDADRDRLFQRFYRGDPARTRDELSAGEQSVGERSAGGAADSNAGPAASLDGALPSTSVRAASGAGLGLAIAQWVAHVHGGAITLAATGPQGSRFELRLPASALPGMPGSGKPSRLAAAPLDRSAS